MLCQQQILERSTKLNTTGLLEIWHYKTNHCLIHSKKISLNELNYTLGNCFPHTAEQSLGMCLCKFLTILPQEEFKVRHY